MTVHQQKMTVRCTSTIADRASMLDDCTSTIDDRASMIDEYTSIIDDCTVYFNNR